MKNEKKMSDEALEARRAYMRKWKKKNRARLKEYERRFWEKRAAQSREHDHER